MSLNELEARLQQIWNEMSQDITQNLYSSMLDRIASCIRARGGSIGVILPVDDVDRNEGTLVVHSIKEVAVDGERRQNDQPIDSHSPEVFLKTNRRVIRDNTECNDYVWLLSNQELRSRGSLRIDC
ncbi:hypothetical protein TNCV_2342741 [Trichonephila clavipes]|nr:hypothetical protein TNCV_2342741 [Trichonephila clavipes]